MAQALEGDARLAGDIEAGGNADAVSRPAQPERATMHSEDNAREWRDHPVNIRLSFPIPGFGRKYLVIVAGDERRSSERLKAERAKHPLFKFRNALFLLGAGAFIGASVVGLLYFVAIYGMYANGTLSHIQ